MPVNILYVSHTASLTGSSVSLFQLMTNLDNSSFRPIAAFSKNGPIAEKLSSRGIPVHIMTRRGFMGIGLIREAMSILRSDNIGLVHLNCASPFSKYIGIASRLLGIPVVWHIREDPQGNRVRQLGKWIRLLSNAIFVVSSDLYKHFSKTGKAFLIYNGVDTTAFSPGDGSAFRDSFNIPRNAFVFGMVGTIEHRKGNVSFMEAARLLGVDSLDPYFVMVGGGTQDAVDEVKRIIRESPHLSERVVLTGKLFDMPGVMNGIDVLVMPSLWEGFPRALIEAMACAKPAVATKVGEVGRIIEEGGTGFLIPAGDTAALTGAMKRCINMRDMLAVMGEKARAKALADLSIEGHVGKVCALYRNIVTKLPGTRP